MAGRNFETKSIKTVKATNFFHKLSSYDGVYIIKIDTQAHDALILSSISNQLLSKTRFIMVEVWSQPGIQSAYINRIAEICAYFPDIHTKSNPNIQLFAYDVVKIWTSKNGKTTDLITA
jgi:hypothetical protein